jgi:hypothetical protein
MTRLSITSALFALLLSSACAVDVAESDTGANGNGDDSGNGDGNGSGNGDGSGSGSGDGNGSGNGGDGGSSDVCSASSLVGAQQEGYFLAGDEPAVFADVYVEDDQGYESLVVSVANDAAGMRIGPGSYELSLEESLGACNPCVMFSRGGVEDVEFFALASAGTLQINAADGQVGGRFSGEITGLELVEVDDEGAPTACQVAGPAVTFDVTLEEF